MFPLTTTFAAPTVNTTQNIILENNFYNNTIKNDRSNYANTIFDIDANISQEFQTSNETVNQTDSFFNFDNYTEYAEIPYYIKATSMSFCVVIMCLGVIGNVMVPIVILKTKDMRNSTNIFLVNLSIADLMVLLVCTPTVLVEVNSKPETWVLGKELCLAVPFVELTVAHASVLTILAISFERYYAICEPLRAGYVCTKTRATLICGLAWFFAALFTSPILAIAEHRTNIRGDKIEAQCLTQAVTFWQITFFAMVIFILFLLPLIMLIILYTIIARNLINAASKVVMNKTVDPCNTRARKQVILMLGTVVLCFFICLLPYRILALWIIVAPTELTEIIDPETWYNLLYFSRIMLYINSAVNPILYNLMSSKFRIGFCKVCICDKDVIVNVRRGGNRNRTGTLTNGSTSSSLIRTTNSLKKLFRHKDSLDRTNTALTEETKDRTDNEEKNILDRLFTRNFFRQNSAPISSNTEIVKINRMCSEGNIEVGNANKIGHVIIKRGDAKFIGHSKNVIGLDIFEQASMRSVIVTAKSIDVSTPTRVDAKIDVECVIDKKFACSDVPESFV